MADEDSTKLEAPELKVEDPGAHDLESSDSEDHFSDAPTSQKTQSATPQADLHIAIPVTRVEKVDNEPSHGEVPGTDAYKLRAGDAEPDEIAVVPESESLNVDPNARPTTPGGHPIPTTVVERIDDTPAHGEIPGTEAHRMRELDAVPDMVVLSPSHSRSASRSDSISSQTRFRAGSTPGDRPIPTTRVELVDDTPSYGEVPGTAAYEKREEDALPDVVEVVGDTAGSPTSSVRSQKVDTPEETVPITRSPISAPGAKDYDENEDGGEEEAEEEADDGDDFDDFEEGDEDAEFGDFDDGFQEPEPAPPPPLQSLPASIYPVLDFSTLPTPESLRAATQPYLDALFPSDDIDASTLPTPTNASTAFLSDRSASLWSQLVAPPPLQPPNWIRSRIRRLFLVSLGVPVDLDEILPASKQKKLILPSTNLHVNSASGSPRSSTDTRRLAQLKGDGTNDSHTSVDSSGAPRQSSSNKSKRKGPAPPPEFDLVSARQLCSITDLALENLDMQELKEHIKHLEEIEVKSKESLEYWTKRTDELLGDREAFEGVIENLVKHARKVRK